MASGSVPASFTCLKSRDHCEIGFAKSSVFIRVCDLLRVKFRRTKVVVIRNATNPGRETVELEAASNGGPLLDRLTADLTVEISGDAVVWRWTYSCRKAALHGWRRGCSAFQFQLMEFVLVLGSSKLSEQESKFKQ